MTSEERHEARYQRRKQRRREKYLAKFENELCFEKIFEFEHLYKSFKKCCNGVNWKASTQRYKANAIVHVASTHKQLQEGKYRSKGFYEFDIMERGKPRHIQSVHINERVVQKCFCDYSLVKVLSNSFIYDNGASLKNKGVDFSMNRLREHLHRYYREYGTNKGYVLQFDFSKYFERIVQSHLFEQLDKKFDDAKIRNLLHHFIDMFGDCGLGLGSQVSQICALLYPNKIDHICKEKLHIKYYGRYMDDGYLIHPDKEYLKYCLTVIQQLCDELGIQLNVKKTQITRIDKPFIFLKHRFCLTATGKIICKPRKHCATDYRHKFNKLQLKYQNKRIDLKDIQQTLQSILGHLKKSNSYDIQRQLYWYCQQLFNNQLQIKGGVRYRPLFYFYQYMFL